jgi:hypothetical protein
MTLEQKIEEIVRTVAPRGAFDSNPENCVKTILAAVFETRTDAELDGLLEEIATVNRLCASRAAK